MRAAPGLSPRILGSWVWTSREFRPYNFLSLDIRRSFSNQNASSGDGSARPLTRQRGGRFSTFKGLVNRSVSVANRATAAIVSEPTARKRCASRPISSGNRGAEKYSKTDSLENLERAISDLEKLCSLHGGEGADRSQLDPAMPARMKLARDELDEQARAVNQLDEQAVKQATVAQGQRGPFQKFLDTKSIVGKQKIARKTEMVARLQARMEKLEKSASANGEARKDVTSANGEARWSSPHICEGRDSCLNAGCVETVLGNVDEGVEAATAHRKRTPEPQKRKAESTEKDWKNSQTELKKLQRLIEVFATEVSGLWSSSDLRLSDPSVRMA